ncbi:hypothetical protein N9D52_06580 [Flavobacteriaceae bacterium]|nr:hypothetical protein [Flavobacteriaceae bacterium]
MNQKRITNQILEQTNYTLNSTLNYLFNISNMKKLFSYLLISSMVVLSSCTNYDDQFDDLNTQINSLKSQIEGFSSLSSGLTALQGTVASLQTAIANIPVTPATDISGLESTQAALTASLTALAADVKALQDTLATAATAAEVAALQTALTAAQTDLTELLAQNNIYSTDVAITNNSTLDFANALGDKVFIVNGKVEITQTADMDATKLAAVMARFNTVTGLVDFTSTATGITTTPAFTKLASAASVKITQKADVSLPELTSTGALNIVDDNKITSVSAPKVTKITALTNATFNKVTNFDMSSLVRLPAALSLSVDSGTVDLSSLISTTDATPVAESGFKIEVDGATVVKAPLITGGELDMDSVTEPNFPVWEGHAGSQFDKAKKVVLPAITGVVAINLETMAPKATYFHYIGNDGDDASTTSDDKTYKFPSFVSASNGNIETLIVGGSSTSVSVTGATDLTSFTITGGTHALTLNDNDSMTAYDLGHTSTITNNSYGAISSGSLVITGNADITSVTAASLDDINTLTITSNASLETLSFASLNSLGTDTDKTALAAGEANVNIHTNDITASNIQLPTAANVLPAVAGKITSASGLASIKTFMAAAIAKRGTADTTVAYDNVTVVTKADGDAAVTGQAITVGTSTTNTQTWGGEDSTVYLVKLDAGTAGSALVPVSLQRSSYGLATSGTLQTDDFISVNPLGTGDLAKVTLDAAFKAKYGITATFATDLDSWASHAETELNAQLVAGSYNFEVEIEKDFGSTKTYLLDLSNDGSLSEASGRLNGPLTFTYGGKTFSDTVTEDTDEGIHEAIVRQLSSSASPLSASYTAATVAGGVKVTPKVEGIIDYSSAPTFSSFGFAGNYSNAASTTSYLGASNTINLTGQSTASGYRFTVVNNSTSVKADRLDLASAASHTTSSGTIALTELVDGTSISGVDNNLQRDWINATAEVPAGSATGTAAINITAWL